MRSTVSALVDLLGQALGRLDAPLSKLLPVGHTGTPQVIAHRGDPRYPENSLAGLDHALRAGADGVEFDIVMDGMTPLVAHHLPADGAPTLKDTLSVLRGRGNRIFVHYKRDNERPGADVCDHVAAVAQAVEGTGTIGSVVVMVESGDAGPWVETAPHLPILLCWTGPYPQPTRLPLSASLTLGLGHVGVYHHHRQLSRPGRWLHRLGMRRIGSWMGFGPIRRMVRNHHGRQFVAFTVNDPFLMRLYAAAGFAAIGTDDPAGLRTVIASG